MPVENRITQTAGIKARKTTKQLASCTSVKRLVAVPPTPKCMKESSAKSSSTSSSDSGSGRRGLTGGNASSKLKATKDPSECARLSSCDSTSAEFVHVALPEPEETSKCIPDAAEPPPLDTEQQFKDLDVVHSNLAVNWFSFGDHEVNDFLKTKADQYTDMTASELYLSLRSPAEAPKSPDSVPNGTDNGHSVAYQGAELREYSNTTSPQDKKFEDEKDAGQNLRIQTPAIKDCSGSTNFHNFEDGSAFSEASEATIEAKTQQASMLTKDSGNHLQSLDGNGLHAGRGWWRSKAFLSGLFVVIAIWLSVKSMIEQESDELPPPT